MFNAEIEIHTDTYYNTNRASDIDENKTKYCQARI